MYSTLCSCPILMKLEFPLQIFEKSSNFKFHENSFSGSRVVPCGRTDRRTGMTKLTVSFRNFANGPKNGGTHTHTRLQVVQTLDLCLPQINTLRFSVCHHFHRPLCFSCQFILSIYPVLKQSQLYSSPRLRHKVSCSCKTRGL